MKHEWRKSEKQYYLPQSQPEFISIPNFKFFTIEGQGNPNDQFFTKYIEALYAVSYGIKMSPKKGIAPSGYFDYAVYPLEGVWDLTDAGRGSFTGTINKNELVFKLMIRQPDFVEKDFARQILELAMQNKPGRLLGEIRFEEITEGPCIQMLHAGSYDNEAESFKLMEAFAANMNLQRGSKTHREIYLSDARKVAPENLNTLLRFRV